MSMCRKHRAECHGVTVKEEGDNNPDIAARICDLSVSGGKEHIGGVMEIADKVSMDLLCLGIPVELLDGCVQQEAKILAQSPGKAWRSNGTGEPMTSLSLLLFYTSRVWSWNHSQMSLQF